MDGWTIFFVIALVAALITTAYVLVKKKNEKDEIPTKAVTTPPEVRGVVTVSKTVKVEETPPTNVAVIYEGLHSGAAKHCRSCGCEYASSVTICEICGETL